MYRMISLYHSYMYVHVMSFKVLNKVNVQVTHIVSMHAITR